MDTSIPFLNVSKADEWEPLWDLYGKAHEPFTRPLRLRVGWQTEQRAAPLATVRREYVTPRSGWMLALCLTPDEPRAGGLPWPVTAGRRALVCVFASVLVETSEQA